MIKNKTFFLFGFGQVAKYFTKRLINKKNKIYATSTKKTYIKKFLGKNLTIFHFKDNEYDKKIINAFVKSDYILISIPPTKKGDIVIKKFNNFLKKNTFKKLIYLSATNVYGNHNGSWVTEKSKLKDKTNLGQNRILAEKQWLSISKKNRLNINILRLAGIYSKENNTIKKLRHGSKTYIKKKNHFFSRIRIEDIAQVIEKTFNKNKINNQIFNVSDNKPASNEEVVKFVSKLIRLKKIIGIDYNLIKNKKLKNFYTDSKKVSNNKMKKILKVKLMFPDYIRGFKNLRNKST